MKSRKSLTFSNIWSSSHFQGYLIHFVSKNIMLIINAGNIWGIYIACVLEWDEDCSDVSSFHKSVVLFTSSSLSNYILGMLHSWSHISKFTVPWLVDTLPVASSHRWCQGCCWVQWKKSKLFIYGSTALRWTLAAFSVSWSFYTVGRTPWTGDQPVARPLPAHRTGQTQNKRTQTSMPQVEFEPTIPAFERAKTVHILDRAAAAIGRKVNCVS
jgi:hypothetical protein